MGEGAASTAVTRTEMDERSCAREQDRISRRVRQLTTGLLVFLQHLERRKQHPVYSRVHVSPTVKGLGVHGEPTPVRPQVPLGVGGNKSAHWAKLLT